MSGLMGEAIERLPRIAGMGEVAQIDVEGLSDV
jgi:hypothetical protein